MNAENPGAPPAGVWVAGAESLADRLHADLHRGLTRNEAQARLQRDGPNELATQPPPLPGDSSSLSSRIPWSTCCSRRSPSTWAFGY